MARTEQNVTENEQKAEAMELNKAEAVKQDEQTATVVSAAEAAFERDLDENDTGEIAETQSETKLPPLWLYRRAYTNKTDGKQYWEYVLPAVFCGQRSEVGFKTVGEKDVGGYRLLEQLFDSGVKKVPFRAKEEPSVNRVTGKPEKRWTYAAYVEVDGFPWEVPLTTRRPSDRAVLENYIRYLQFVAERDMKAGAAAQTGARA